MAHKIKLRDYVDEKVRGVYLFSKGKYQTIDKSTKLAADSLEKRLETMNEFREALKDQQTRFVTREEFGLIRDRLSEDIRILREAKANTEGKASQTSVYISYLIAIIALAISIIRIFV